MTRLAVTLAVCLLLLTGSSSRADGWSIGALNPFASKTKKPEAPAGRRTYDNTFPQFPGERRPQVKKPSTWSKFQSGTKNFMNKTVDTITFWDNKPAKVTPPSDSAGRMGKSYSGVRMSKPEPEKKGFFSPITSFFAPKPKPKRPETVQDFLDMPRPY